MSTEKKGIIKRTKSFLLMTLLAAVVIESFVLYRLYRANVAITTVAVDESGELLPVEGSFNDKVDRLRKLFKDSSADAWAKARESDDPESTWFKIGYHPRTDIRETEKSYVVSIDVPGVKPAELSATVNGLSLTVSGVRSQSKMSGDLIVRERFRGEFSRSFEIPGKISADGVKAVVSDGVLRVTIPKGNSDDLDIAIDIVGMKLM